MKEQMSRNFLRVLGPFSDPVLVATLESNATGAITNNMTFLWIDPTGQLAEVSEMHIEYGHMVCFILLVYVFLWFFLLFTILYYLV